MALEASVKKAIIDEYATHPGDTGSPEVQVAMLTHRIKDLTEHLKDSPTALKTKMLGKEVGPHTKWFLYVPLLDALAHILDVEEHGVDLRPLFGKGASHERCTNG